MADGSYVAFFEVPVSEAAQKDPNTPGWVQHLALEVKDMDALDPANAAEDKYYARGVGLILTIQTTGPAEREQATVVERV